MDPRNIHHRYAPNAAVKYDTQSSPLNLDPRWIAGQNVLTSIKGQCERRPGFPAGIETNTTTFYTPNGIQRILGWRKWGGPTFVLVNEVTDVASTVYFIVVGNPSYSNFTTLFSSTTNKAFDFTSFNNVLYFSNGADSRKWNGDVINLSYKWGVNSPSAPPSIAIQAVPSGVTATQGYFYVYCYGTLFGHVSSPSPVSLSTGVFASTSGPVITVQYSTDPQVNQIFLFRSTDGGGPGGPFFLMPGEATITNNTAGGTANIVDHWPDDLLLSTFAPPFFANDPPPPLTAVVEYASRLVGCKDDTIRFSNNEEQTIGVAAESFAPTNTFRFGAETTALTPVNEGLLVHCDGSRIHKISGDSLDTFRQDPMFQKSGCRYQPATVLVGKSAGWVDSRNLLRMSDGYQQQEWGLDIRPDIQAIDQSKAQITFHSDGRNQWLVLLDGGAGKLRVYDLDRQMWMPPWNVGGSAIASVETSPGVFQLLLAHTSGKVLAANLSAYNDNGNAYPADITLCLVPICAEDTPGHLGLDEYFVLERDSKSPSDVLALIDEDPNTGTFTSIFANKETPPLRQVTTGLVEDWYYYRSIPGRRAAHKIVWPTEDANFKLYGFDVAGSQQQTAKT